MNNEFDEIISQLPAEKVWDAPGLIRICPEMGIAYVHYANATRAEFVARVEEAMAKVMGDYEKRCIDIIKKVWEWESKTTKPQDG